MSNFSEQQKAKTEVKEKNKVRKEKLAGYFFDLSKLTFAGLVIGGISPLFSHDEYKIVAICVAIFGVVTTLLLAKIANEILKY